MTKHVPRHQLERLMASPGLRADAAARVHIASCDACAVRKRAFERARERYLAAYPKDEFVRAVQELAAQPEAVPSLWRRLLGWFRKS